MRPAKRIAMRVAMSCVALLAVGAVTLLTGLLIGSEAMEIAGAWLMVPLTALMAAVLAVWLIATCLSPLAAAIEAARRRNRR